MIRSLRLWSVRSDPGSHALIQDEMMPFLDFLRCSLPDRPVSFALRTFSPYLFVQSLFEQH
jgi:hypothetical protein